LINNNSSIKNFNFKEDSKIFNVVNTSPSTSVNKNLRSSITPPTELEKNDKIKEINQIKDFNTKHKIDNYPNNLSKSNKSPYNKDKFLKHIKATSSNFTNSNNYKDVNKHSNLFNNNIINNNNDNSTNKRKMFQNNFLAQSKLEKSNFCLKENYKSENEFINNINNINRTKTPNTKSMNRDFSENVIYSNITKPKNHHHLNYTNRENTLNILSDRDRENKNTNTNTNNNIYVPNLPNNINTLGNLNKNSNYNLDKKTGNFNYNLKNPAVNQGPCENESNLNNSTKNISVTGAGGVYQFKPNPIYQNSIINKSINGSLISNNNNNPHINNKNSITISMNNANNIKDLLGNNINLSLNLNSKIIFLLLFSFILILYDKYLILYK
jgi:hypothetical protein